MRDGICPKCNSKEICSDAELSWRSNSYGLNQVVIRGQFFNAVLVKYDNYLCTDCGYMERYIDNTSERQLVKENWSKLLAE